MGTLFRKRAGHSGFPADAKGRECGAQARSPSSLSFLQPRGSAARSSLGHSPGGGWRGCCLAAGCSPSHDPLISSSRAFTQPRPAPSRARLPRRGGSGYRLQVCPGSSKAPACSASQESRASKRRPGTQGSPGWPFLFPRPSREWGIGWEAEMLPLRYSAEHARAWAQRDRLWLIFRGRAGEWAAALWESGSS